MNLDKYPNFVGRQQIINQITNPARPDEGRNRAVLLHGAGGVGKTWLLRALADRPLPDPTLLRTPLIDMDDTAFHLPSHFGRVIAEALGIAAFADYLNAVEYYHDEERRRIELRTISAHLRRSEDVFIRDYNKLAGQKRVMMLIDTFDDVQDTDLWNFFKRLIDELANTTFVFAGRRVGELAARLDDEKVQVELIKMEGLSGDEIDAFFSGVVAINDERKRKLALLTAGNPLLLCLALDCYRSGDWLDEIDQTPESRIQKLVKKRPNDPRSLRHKFEKNLVMAYAKIEPFPTVIRLLSHAPRRVNWDIFRALVRVPSEPKAAEWWEILQKLPYVRRRASGDFISVHDALRELILKHVMPVRDPDYFERKKIVRRVIQCYDKLLAEVKEDLQQTENSFAEAAGKQGGMVAPNNQVGELALLVNHRKALERKLWILQSEVLYYHFSAEIVDGSRIFIQQFDEATRQRQLTLRQRLAGEVKTLLAKGVIPAKSNEHFELGCRVAKQEADDGQVGAALKRVDKLLSIYTAAEQNVRLLELRGDCKLSLDKGLEKAISDYKKARTKAEKGRGMAIDCARLEKLLGWSYRQLGNFIRAGNWYKQAQERLAHIKSTDPRILQEEASICTNAAYIEALCGNFDQAVDLGLRGLQFRQAFDLPREQAMSYSTLGEIYRYRRSFAEALEFYRKAEDLFNSLDDRGWLGRLWQQQAICRLQMGGDLSKALNEAELAIDFCARYNPLALPSAYNRAGRIVAASSQADRFQKGLTYFQKGSEAALEVDDSWFYLANCVEALEMAQQEYESTKNAGLLKIIDALDKKIAAERKKRPSRKRIKSEQYVLHLLGRREIALGTIAYQRGLEPNDASLLTKALRHYVDGFRLIASGLFGSYGSVSMSTELKRLAERFRALPQEIASSWRNRFAQQWKTKEVHPVLTQFVDDVANIPLE